MSDVTAEAKAEAEAAAKALAEACDEIEEIHELFRNHSPEAWERLKVLNTEIPLLREKAKEAARKVGAGMHELHPGHFFQVKRPPTKIEIDTEGLLERAEQRGEIDDLLDAEVLEYKVNPHQIDRLTGPMKAVYSTYVTKKSGMSAVSLPLQLK